MIRQFWLLILCSNFELIFMYGVRKGSKSILLCWIISCPSTIAEKIALSVLNFLGTLGENQLSILWFSSVEADISHLLTSPWFFSLGRRPSVSFPGTPCQGTLIAILDLMPIMVIHPKGNQSWIFIGRTDAEAETPNTLATWCEELTH